MDREDCYQILGVEIDDSMGKITRRWKELNKQYHPDKNQGLPESERIAKEQKLARINNAYSILKRRRTAYDFDYRRKRKSDSTRPRAKSTPKAQPKAQPKPKPKTTQTPPRKETKTSSYWDSVVKEAEDLKRKEAERKREERIRQNQAEQQAREKKLREEWEKQAEAAAQWKTRTEKERADRQKKAEESRAEAERIKRKKAEEERNAREKRERSERPKKETKKPKRKPGNNPPPRQKKIFETTDPVSRTLLQEIRERNFLRRKRKSLSRRTRVITTVIMLVVSLCFLPQYGLYIPVAAIVGKVVPEEYWHPFGLGFLFFAIIAYPISWWLASKAPSFWQIAGRFLLFSYAMCIGAASIITIIKM